MIPKKPAPDLISLFRRHGRTCSGHLRLCNKEGVDARNKCGHDDKARSSPDLIQGGNRFSEKIMLQQNVRLAPTNVHYRESSGRDLDMPRWLLLTQSGQVLAQQGVSSGLDPF
jgi:hypothetical protein